MGMWLPNMQRLGPNISTSGIIQGFNCSSFQFMPKMHSTAEMLTPVLPHRLMASKSVCPSPLAIDAKINRPAHYCDREANFWILADYVQEIGQLRGEHFQPAAQIRSLQALKTLQPLWVRHQIGPWSEAAKRIVGVPFEMLAHGSQVRKRAVDIQALRQVWIAEVNQANKRNWDFRSYSQLLRPRHLLDGILGDEFVPDEAVYLPRAGCSEIVIEKVSPWQRGVIPDKSFKSRIFPCKNTVAVGSTVVEMSVRIDDCCPAGERWSCHFIGPLLGLQRVPGGAGCGAASGTHSRFHSGFLLPQDSIVLSSFERGAAHGRARLRATHPRCRRLGRWHVRDLCLPAPGARHA